VAFKQTILRAGVCAKQTADELEADHERALETIRLLERQLAAALTVKPVYEQTPLVTGLAGVLDGLTGEDRSAARGLIARAVPTDSKSLNEYCRSQDLTI
jgi:hypothetical protein